MSRPVPFCHLTIAPSEDVSIYYDNPGEVRWAAPPPRLCIGSRCSGWERLTDTCGACALNPRGPWATGCWPDPAAPADEEEP